MKLAEKSNLLKLDIALCRVTGDLGAAMKHAFEAGDTELYDQLRKKRLEVSLLRDELIKTR
jgi:hypothetical protein